MAKHLTKLSFLLILLVALSSCERNFSFDELEIERDTIDEEGDPVIENPLDDGTREFGLDNSYCYGFSVPDEEIAKIDIEIDYPESDFKILCEAWISNDYSPRAINSSM